MLRNISFFKPTIAVSEETYLQDILANSLLLKERHYSDKSVSLLNDWFPKNTNYLTKSCTQSLELAAHLRDIKEGADTVILGGSSANSFFY